MSWRELNKRVGWICEQCGNYFTDTLFVPASGDVPACDTCARIAALEKRVADLVSAAGGLHDAVELHRADSRRMLHLQDCQAVVIIPVKDGGVVSHKVLRSGGTLRESIDRQMEDEAK